MTDALLSSPDPLALSNNNIPTSSPTKSRGAVLTPRKALTNASGNAHVQDIYLTTPPARNTSPTKSPKHRAQSTSPWRIRLTVQAEQVNEMQDGLTMRKTPTKRLTERTTTITVPLKGGDDTPPVVGNRGRGRPRKSLDAPMKRNGTPKPKKAVRRKTVPESLEEEQDENFLAGRATPHKKARGRLRKSMEPVVNIPQFIEPGVSLHTSDMVGIDTDAAARKTTRRKSKARRMEITPMKIAVDSDVESPGEATGRTVDDSISECKLGPDDHLQETKSVESSAIGISSPEKSLLEEQDEEMWRAMICLDGQSPSIGNEEQEEQADLDPTNEHQEFDTILESEGFSMVSVSSLASTGDRNAIPAELSGAQNVPDQDSELALSPSVLPRLQERNKHLEAREHTPAIASSPSVPPVLQDPPQQSPHPLEKATDGTPKLARVVRAGIALQGVLSPKEKKKLGLPFRSSERPSPFLAVGNAASQRRHSSPVSKAKSPKDRLDDLFSEFGAGTRRELKAGLRLGEELAKRQLQMSQKPESVLKAADDVFSTGAIPEYPSVINSQGKTDYNLKAPGSSQAVRYPQLSNNQLPSPERSVEDSDEDRMSWKADTPMKPEYPTIIKEQETGLCAPLMKRPTPHGLSQDKTVAPEASGIDHTMLAREAEWQREREAVSRRIDMANKSQVVVIESDDDEDPPGYDDDDEDGSDIWQAEASQSREPTPEASEILLKPQVVKPRRSKLPSPWRRNSEVLYSDEVEPTEADLFWQPDRSKAKAPMKQTDTGTQAEEKVDDSTGALLEHQLNPVKKPNLKTTSHETSKASLLEVPVPTNNVNNDPLNMPVTPEQTHTKEFSDMFEEDTTLSPVGDRTIDALPVPNMTPIGKNTADTVSSSGSTPAGDKTVDPFTSSIEIATTAIDPLLLQKPTRKATKKQAQKPIQAPAQRPSAAIVSLNAADTQTSWMSRLTAPIWRAFTSLPPPATREDILCSGPYEPLCQFTPWEGCHFRALQPLYYASLLYGSHIFPYNRCSITAAYLGMKVITQGGWSRTITQADCGITDAFMVLLEERGFALAEQPGEQWIDEGLAVKQCVALWVQMVMRGEVEVDRNKEETVGLRKEGDRLWTKEDIDWTHNQSEYLERKKREFDGLPSWKEKGIQWQ